MKNCTHGLSFVRGGAEYPDISGTVRFTQKENGVLVQARITGLPHSETGFFALHIHEGESCKGVDFADTMGHYNPGSEPHPRHAGDLPPLLSAGSTAYSAVFTDRFTLSEIIGRTVVIHSGPDDFHTQPGGNSGAKIACGVIRCGYTPPHIF